MGNVSAMCPARLALKKLLLTPVINCLVCTGYGVAWYTVPIQYTVQKKCWLWLIEHRPNWQLFLLILVNIYKWEEKFNQPWAGEDALPQ